jgi:glycosyltransferase involved in cell wall biosynthesis
MKISTVILTKDEEENIAECIKSIQFCDEILVVDDNSNDRTREIAKKLGAKVFKRSLDNNYAKQKNFALRKAKEGWVLFLDADERISEKLKNEILDTVNNSYQVYQFSRIDYFLGKWLKNGDIKAYLNIRLMKKNSGIWRRRVHEYFETKARVGKFRNPLLHYSHPTVGKLIDSTNRWSSWHAKANQEEGKKSSIMKIFFWPMGKFVDSFILKRGFRDGLHGFVFSIFMSMHSFLAWSTLWLLQKNQ